MRVSDELRNAFPWIRPERGVTSVIVGISLVALVAALMLVADAGNLWVTRRTILTGTDAVALQEARAAALQGPASACMNWAALLKENAGSDAEPISCRVTTDPGGASGHVTVEARLASDVRFGGIFGIGDQSAYSLSAAQWNQASGVDRVRPIGICVENTHVQGYIGTGTDAGVDPAPGVHRVSYTKQQPDACGGNAPGNWGFVDLDGGSNSNADLSGWIEEGYPEVVTVRDCDSDGNPSPCEADTGSSGCSVCPSLQKLVDTGETFPVIIFDEGLSDGGSNVRYDIFAFLGVRLHGFMTNGKESERYLDLEFVDIVRSGPCCRRTGPNTGVYSIRLCAVDHDPVPEAVRCS